MQKFFPSFIWSFNEIFPQHNDFLIEVTRSSGGERYYTYNGIFRKNNLGHIAIRSMRDVRKYGTHGANEETSKFLIM